MKKLIQMVDVIDSVILNDLIYLHRLLRLYVRFMHDYNKVELMWSDKGSIVVKFFKVHGKEGHLIYTEREFPFDQVSEKINKYKEKVAHEFANRHNNLSILREKEIHKWKKVIEHAKLQMSE